MASFDYRENEACGIAERFRGEDVAHYELWSSLHWAEPDRAASDFLGQVLTQRAATKRRLFISHTRTDTNLALDVVSWCNSVGLDYWLDVLDPSLNAVPKSSSYYALTIAAIIEMALLNCTHVLVVYTDDAATSRWVPYEYGRVKIPTVRSLQAAAWNETALTTLPEYLLLGTVCRPRASAEKWVKSI